MARRKFAASTPKEALVKAYEELGKDMKIVSSGKRREKGGKIVFEVVARTKSGGRAARLLSEEKVKFLISTGAVIFLIVVISVLFWPAGDTDGTKEGQPGITPPTIEPAHSIAVLPFVNLGSEEDGEHFGDGLAEELISALANLQDLRVVARTSAFTFRDRELDIRSIGENLNVRTILEGSYRRQGNRLRIIANLVDVGDGYTVWTRDFDRELSDLFAIQEELSFAIANALKIEMKLDESRRLRKRSTRNLEAFNAYHLGLFYLDQRTETGFHRAIEHFNEATGLDPGYALAHSALARSYYLLGGYGLLPIDEALEKTRAEVETAIQLDSALGEAYATRAMMRRDYELDWAGAEKDLLLAIDLSPNNGTAHHWFGLLLGDLGRFDEAMKQLLIAVEIEPLSRQINHDLAAAYVDHSDTDAALLQLENILKMYPGFKGALNLLMMTLIREREYEQALNVFKDFQQKAGNPQLAERLEGVYRKSGVNAALREYIAISGDELVPYDLAVLYQLMGRKEKAIEYLELAFGKRNTRVFHLQVEPLFSDLLSDKRVVNLLVKMGLKQAAE